MYPALVMLGEFQGAAPLGIVVEAVVCVPLTKTHFIVSPQTALKIEGENASTGVVATPIMCTVALAERIPSTNASEREIIE